jgi:small redox-active disulfide protein 2
MKVEILGTGCPKCQQLLENARIAAEEAVIPIKLVKVTDIDQITDYGVMMTPALAVDGNVVSSGKLLSKEEIKTILTKSV